MICLEHTTAIELRHITKRFGKVVANDDISLEIRRGEILSLLGENGSGKTTLMNMLAGIYFPDEGKILVNGEPTTIASPKDAFACGIGMIHQHFKLVDVFSAAENIVLGLDGERKLDLKAASAKILEISEKYGFSIDPNKKIYDMSVSEKQTVEIIKVLYRGADILILDEPTAVLTPQETDRLFDVMRNMKADGKALVIITHKLHEVMDVSDRVAVLRKGRYIGDVATCDTSPQKLTDMMVGHAVTLNIDRPLVEAGRFWALPASPAAARRNCWRPSPACGSPSPGPTSSIIPPPPTNPSPVSMCRWTRAVRSCWARIPGRSTTSACPWPLCRRTG